MKKISKRFYKDSKSYYLAATILVNSQLRENDEQLLLIPIIYNLRHSLELIFKSHILNYLEYNTSLTNFENFKMVNTKGIQLNDKLFKTHSIKKLMECFIYLDKQRMIPFLDKNNTKFLKNSLKHIIRLDKSDYFRYPFGNLLKKHERNFVKINSLFDNDIAPEIKPNEELFITEDKSKIIITKHFSIMYMQNELAESIEMLSLFLEKTTN